MKTFKSFFLLLFASALVFSVNSCKSGNGEEELPDFNMVRTAEGFKEFIDEHGGFESAQILDFRSAEDFANGHVPGAVNIPATAVNTDNGEFAQEVMAFFPDKSKPIYMYGGMMLDNVVAGRISGLGYGKVNSNLLMGGFNAWKAAFPDEIEQ
ncbi:MAG: rhodanese-like domain-containing protein [Prevotellaceae bacterium]|jgi:rhodanese-related sulfurtransferase|nr:rhodanese-like domain-containing protein [Prevotellaceae bacterium]